MRYFGAAVAFQIVAWALLLASSDALLEFAGGLGPVFGALHLLTLGVLALTAVGASLQMLPVATRQPVRSVAAAKWVWWLFTPGVLFFAGAAADYRPQLMAAGALAVLAALGVFAWLLFANLRAARGMRAIRAYGWAAFACLVGMLLLGMAVVGYYERGIALDRPAFALAHLVLASYGFMGLLALGFSCFMLPMFALAPPPSERLAGAALALALAAIALSLAASFAGRNALLIALACLLGLAAAVTHVVMMERSLRARLRPPLGAAFLLVRVSWACLAASLLLGAGLALEWLPQRFLVLFGVLLVPGWLVTFLLAVLQKIVPFLASVHAGAAGRGPALVSSMTPERTLAAHRVLHLGALALLAAGTAAGFVPLIQAGLALGLAAAIAFAAFFATVLLRLRNSRGNSDVLQPTS
jgi:hypothetical protein